MQRFLFLVVVLSVTTLTGSTTILRQTPRTLKSVVNAVKPALVVGEIRPVMTATPKRTMITFARPVQRLIMHDLRPKTTHQMRGVQIAHGPRLFIRPSTVLTRKTYTPLNDQKVHRYLAEAAKHEGPELGAERVFQMTHGRGVVAVGMILEGTMAFSGILPDIVVDQRSRDILFARFNEELTVASTRRLGAGLSTDDYIDCAERAVRKAVYNSDMDDFKEFCETNSDVKDARNYDSHLPLSFFLERSIGDCRINALSLGLLMAKIPGIHDVKYSNRKWGSTTTPHAEEVGQQGEHASIQFSYDTSPHVVVMADSFDVRYDRVPLNGPRGVVPTGFWYNVLHSRLVGNRHNVWESLVNDNYLETVQESMLPRSRERFEEMATLLKSNQEHAYLSRKTQFPALVSTD